MSIENLTKAFKIIDCIEKGKKHFSGEKSENLILKAEEALGLIFPPTYRIFLKKYGCGNIRYTEIYGIVNEDFEQSCIPDGVWLTLTERAEFDIPHSIIIIADTGDGYYYVIDTSKKNADGDSPVFVWDVDEDEPTEKINEDFGDFLLDRAQFALQPNEYDDQEDD